MTFPITDSQVVLGKFLATFVVYLLMLAPTLVYVVVIRAFGGNEWGPLLSAYLGLVLLGAVFIAVGIFSSSLASEQPDRRRRPGIGILLLLMWVLGARGTGRRGARPPPRRAGLWRLLPLPQRPLQNLGSGVIDLKDVSVYLSLIAAALFLTVRVLEFSRRRA